MSINYEMERYTELTGEDGTKIPISRLGAYLDGYDKGRTDERSKVISMLEDYSDKLNTLDFSEWRVKGMICDIIEQLKRG